MENLNEGTAYLGGLITAIKLSLAQADGPITRGASERASGEGGGGKL